MSSWLFPLGLKPRSGKHEGPHYADIYARSIAATIDLGILFLMLNDLFFAWSKRIYQGVDKQMLQQAQHAPHADVMPLLVESNALSLLMLNAGVQMAVLGTIILGVQMVWFTTPGKWLLGLKIVDAKTLQTPSRGRFVVRFLGYIVAASPLMVGIVWATFNKQRRGWHDYIAGTAVIHTRNWSWYKQHIQRLYAKLRSRST